MQLAMYTVYASKLIVDESAGYAIFSQPRTKEIGMNTVVLAIYCEIIRRAPSIPGKSKQDSMLV